MKCKLKSYKPEVFQRLRRIADVDEDEYMKSMCSRPLEEMLNPGASGARLYSSSDRKYIIKTVQGGEADLLKAILKKYERHLKMHPQSLLPKFLGYYTFKLPGEKKQRLLVMKNLFAAVQDSEARTSEGETARRFEKFDLKGSRYKRSASAAELGKLQPTLKDLDFIDKHPAGIELDEDTYDWLMMTVRHDCMALQEWDVMDYSLLMGVDFRQPRAPRIPAKVIDAESGEAKHVELSLGLIDILQEFTIVKLVESTAKGLIRSKDDVSVVEPKKYRKRFEAFLANNVFRHHNSPPADVDPRLEVLTEE